MRDEFRLLLSLSVSGSIMAGLLLMVKPIIKNRISKNIQYILWVIVLMRMIIPFSIENSIIDRLFVDDYTLSESWIVEYDDNINNTTAFEESSSMGATTEGTTVLHEFETDHVQFILDSVFELLFRIWVIVSAVLLMYQVVGYHRFKKYLRAHMKEGSNKDYTLLERVAGNSISLALKRHGGIETPMLVGIIRPVIMLPDEEYSEETLINILRHEVMHYRKKDIIIKWFMMFVTTIHWNNPIMILVKKEVNHICELACDEAVIKSLDTNEKQRYGDALIDVVTKDKPYTQGLQVTLYEEKATLTERLQAIMKYRKKSKFIKGLSLIIVVMVVVSGVMLGASVGNRSTVKEEHIELLQYEIDELLKYRTPYVGDATKVSHIASLLPAPHPDLEYSGIHLLTEEEPYGLEIYYKLKEGIQAIDTFEYNGRLNGDIATILNVNAYVTYCLIENAGGISYVLGEIPRGKDESNQLSTVDMIYNVPRGIFEEDLYDLSADKEEFRRIINEKSNTIVSH